MVAQPLCHICGEDMDEEDSHPVLFNICRRCRRDMDEVEARDNAQSDPDDDETDELPVPLRVEDEEDDSL